ncbi:hypothetical protein LA345_12935 [Burkholderia vietnamiensis]|uniref:Uncharacterized protein n=1 Tax=Burkholderia vietnamiensis (strain G4 / LMG 22486) TaxID=269482 RepID=A4JFK4_BURVG|nr:hypothetical protein Bcep1808_2055 [Burkholderia vietnamiensis G4]MCB4344817.1 hypothetical protein [Burkholderia vietnamiensis]
MNALALAAHEFPLPIEAAQPHPVGRRDVDVPVIAIELTLDEQLFLIDNKFEEFDEDAMSLVAAAHALPATFQANDPLLEAGRRVAERMRAAHRRFATSIARIARIRDGAMQGEELTLAYERVERDFDDVEELIADTEARTPGAVLRVLDYLNGVSAQHLREARQHRFNPKSHWDYVLSMKSTREAIVRQGHAFPTRKGNLDGYVPGLIHPDDDGWV